MVVLDGGLFQLLLQHSHLLINLDRGRFLAVGWFSYPVITLRVFHIFILFLITVAVVVVIATAFIATSSNVDITRLQANVLVEFIELKRVVVVQRVFQLAPFENTSISVQAFLST